MMRHALPMLVGLQASQRLEVFAGVKLKQHVAVVQVAHGLNGQGSHLVATPRPGKCRRRRRQHAAEQQDQR